MLEQATIYLLAFSLLLSSQLSFTVLFALQRHSLAKSSDEGHTLIEFQLLDQLGQERDDVYLVCAFLFEDAEEFFDIVL